MTNWEICTVSDSCVKSKVGKHNQIPAKNISGVGQYPVIDQGQDFVAGYCDYTSKLITTDLPLIIFGDHTRCFKYVDFPFVLGADGTKVLMPNKQLYDPKFYYYALLALEIPNRGYNRHFKYLKEQSLPLPPLPEQKKIAHILSTVQRAIEAQERIIQTTTKLFKSMLHQLMTAQIKVSDEHTVKRGFKELEHLMKVSNFQLPTSWYVCSIGETYDFTKKPHGLNLRKNGNEVPFFPMDRISSGQIYASDFIIRSVNNLGSGTYVENRDLMVAKITPSFENGKQSILDIDPDFAYATTEVIPIRGVHGKSDTLFLFFYLLHPEVRAKLAGKMEGSTGRQRLSKAVLGDCLILLPPLPDQQQIAHILSTVQKKIDKAQAKKAKLQDLFRTLLHELIAAKIRIHNLEFPNLL